MPVPYLRRFETVVLKNKSGSDTAQVPASATVAFYRQGSTVKVATSVGLTVDPVPVLVYDVGAVIPGDVLIVQGGSGRLLVESITGTDTLNVLNETGSTIVLAVGARLTPESAQPRVYNDALGSSAIGSSIATDPATGRASAYVRDKSFDYIVTGTGLSPRVYPDSDGAFVTSLTGWLNAKQFSSIQAAIEALPASGGTVFLPSGRYALTSSLQISKSQVTLIGEGPASVITTDTPNTFDLVVVTASLFRMFNLLIDGNRGPGTPSPNDKSCLVVNGSAISDPLGQRCYFENLICQNAPNAGLRLIDCSNSLFVNGQFPFNRQDGARFEKVTSGVSSVRFINCTFSENYGRGIHADGCTCVSFHGCGSEGNSQDPTLGVSASDGSAISAHNCQNIRIDSCDFEAPGLPGTHVAVENLVYMDNCTSCVITGSNFRGDGTYTQRGFRSGANGTPGLMLTGCGFVNLYGGNSAPMNAVGLVSGQESNVINCRTEPNKTIALMSPSIFTIVNSRPFRSYATDNDLPDASTVEPGTIAYIVTPSLNYSHLAFSQGTYWQYLVLGS